MLDDSELVAEVRQQLAELLGYGYRDLSDAATVLAQLLAAFEHFNEVHPYSSLKMRSPREFRRQRSQALTNG